MTYPPNPHPQRRMTSLLCITPAPVLLSKRLYTSVLIVTNANVRLHHAKRRKKPRVHASVHRECVKYFSASLTNSEELAINI